MLVNNLGLLEQLAYWKVSSPCSAAGYNLTMKKHRYKPTHLTTLSKNYKVITLLHLQFLNLLFRKVWVTFSNRLYQTSKLIAGLCLVTAMHLLAQLLMLLFCVFQLKVLLL